MTLHLDPDVLLDKPRRTVQQWMTFAQAIEAYRVYRQQEAEWRASRSVGPA